MLPRRAPGEIQDEFTAMCPIGSCVFSRVGQGLRDEVGGANLDRIGNPMVNMEIEVHGNRAAAGQRLKGRAARNSARRT